MPITKELKNLKKFESVGFSHEQSEALADVIEESHADSHESLKEFIRDELEKQIGASENRLSKQINALEVRLMISQKDLLIKIFGIIVGTIGVAVTILKLF